MKEQLTGIICAMEEEAAELLAQMEAMEERVVSGIKFTKGQLAGKAVVVAVCGIGKVFAAICTEAMFLHYAPVRILNSGVAGSLVEELGLAQLAVADSVVQHDMDTSMFGDPIGLVPGMPEIFIPCDEEMAAVICAVAEELGIHAKRGVIASGDRFVYRQERRDALHQAFDAIACEMESGAIAQVCYVNRTPCAVIRTISDSRDGDAAMEYNEFKKIAADQAAAITIGVLKRLPAV